MVRLGTVWKNETENGEVEHGDLENGEVEYGPKSRT